MPTLVSHNRDHRRPTADLRAGAIVVPVLLGLSHQVGLAAEWDYGLAIGLSHTDNLFLSNVGTDDALSYRAIPYIVLEHESNRLNITANYEVDWFRYDEPSDTSVFHIFDAEATARLLGEVLTLTVGGQQEPTIRDPDVASPGGRLFLNGNQLDELTWFVRPALRYDIGQSVTMAASFEYNERRFDEGNLFVQDSDTRRTEFSVENYRRGRGLTWALRHSWLDTEYEVSAPWEYQRAAAELGMWVSDKVRIFGSYGFESPFRDRLDGSLDEEVWEAGLAYQNLGRLQGEIAVGERSFGDSWRANIDLTTPRMSLYAGYSETPTTIGFEDSGPGNLLDSSNPDDFLTRPGAAELLLSRLARAGMSITGRRTALNIAVFDESREDRITPEGIPLGDESQLGAEVRFTFEPTSRTEIAIFGSFFDRELLDTESRFTVATVEFTYRLTRRLSVSVSGTYAEEAPVAGSNLVPYTASVASLFFSWNSDPDRETYVQ